MELLKIAQQEEETISSLEIAKLTNKRHCIILRDIRRLVDQGVQAHKFMESYYDQEIPNGGVKRATCYLLTKSGCLLLASGYNAKLREAIIDRWEQLEREKVQELQSKVPQTFSQALMLAAQQAEKIEQLEAENNSHKQEILQLTSAVASMEKKVTYMDKIFACPSTVKTKTIAQDYGMSAIAFNQMLHKYGIQYKCGDVWVLYAKYLGEGYVKDVPFSFTRNNGSTGVTSNMQWTQKGRAFLYEFLKEKQVLPLIETMDTAV